MITVVWPSSVSQVANVWRVLDLSGMTSSVRQSRSYVKAGYVFLDQSPVTMYTMMEIGRAYRLEIRFPNGIRQSHMLFLTRPVTSPARQNSPLVEYRKA